MSETSFEVVFEGPGLEDGRMPVREFAPALLALGDLIVDASAVVHPEHPPAALKIKATEEGSFVIDLVLEAPKAWDEFVSLFNSDSANAVVNFRDLVIGAGVGLYWFIKQVRGRKIKKREQKINSAKIRVEFDDGTVVEVPGEVLSLYDNLRVRRKVKESIEPVGRNGIERLKFRRAKEVTVEVEKDDLPSYEVPEVEEVPLLDRETEMVLSIASVVFTEGNKWKFTDGERIFSAAIDDPGFADRVNAGVESFRNGDMLRCRMHITQKHRGDVLQTEYSVIEVKEHIPRQVQLNLGRSDEQPPPLALPSGDPV